jgi:hypothetical protein
MRDTARWPALLVGVLLSGIGPANSRAAAPSPCPASIIQAYKVVEVAPFATHAFVYDTTIALDTLSWVRVQFDRYAGHVEFSTHTFRRVTASSRIVESFDVAGVPRGTPVDAVLEFRLDGWVQQTCGGSGCGHTLEGVLAVGSDSARAGGFFGPSHPRIPLAATLSLPIRLVAGTPVEAHFVLTYVTNVGATEGSSEAIGNYFVTGLPPGVRAIACPGGDVTPARRSTWGTLKRIYR